MSATQDIAALQQTITGLVSGVTSGRLLRPALLAGGRVVAAGIREEAPVGRSAKVHRQNRKRAAAGGKQGLPKLKASIGHRVRVAGSKSRQGAKAGPSVGIKKNRRAPQGGWIQAGTKKRYRKDGSYAGQITRTNNFSERGALKSQSRAEGAIISRLETDIQGQLR